MDSSASRSALDSDSYAAFVERTEVTLERAIGRLDQPLLADAAGHLCLGGGKRVRPRLVWAFAQCLEQQLDLQALLDVGVSCEMIHAGSLLHDDVIDQGTTRRAKPTVNVAWGNTVAVLAGDLLLTQALVQMTGHPAKLTTEAVATIAAMTRAAIAEVEARNQIDLTEAEWRGIAEGKTGRLFAWAGRSVGNLAEDRQAVECFDGCGLLLGVAFQLADDLLDLIGEQMGKDRYSDLKNREASLPIVLAMADDPSLKREVEQLWAQAGDTDPTAVATIGDRIAASPATGRAVRQLEQLVGEALERLGPYRQTPGGQLIEQWAQQQLRRRVTERYLP